MISSIKVAEVVAPDLAIRENAKRLILLANDKRDNIIELDFSDVFSISRSFAHELVIQIEKSSKTIRFVDVPSNIKRMLDFVELTHRRNLL